MSEVILDNIPFNINISMIMNHVQIDQDNLDPESIKSLVVESQKIARLKAYYKVASIEAMGDDHVVIEGIKVTSRVLRVNLEGVERCFLYAATSGTELEEWSSSLYDPLQTFWANEILGMALYAALEALDENIAERYDPGPISSMSPGSLDDWPLEEQRGLFVLLGDLQDKIGIRLLDNLWMVPSMSVSGIRFPSEEGFESCQLCPREICPERVAPYDENLYENKYRLDVN